MIAKADEWMAVEQSQNCPGASASWAIIAGVMVEGTAGKVLPWFNTAEMDK